MPKRLQPPFCVKSLMEHGDQFHFAMRTLGNRRDEDFAMLATPFVVSAAFALEVYLKVLTHIERNIMPLHTHNLRNLFYDLTLPTQESLSDEWTRTKLPILQAQFKHPKLPAGFPTIRNFRQASEASAFAFVDWRYATKDQTRFFHIVDLIPEARKIIVALRPDLATRRMVMKEL